MSKLLINEPPILLLPLLAEKIGLNEAIVLQQVHYWLQSSSHVHEGRKWIYNTYEDWQRQFPFWSEKTIKRTFLSLEKNGLVSSKNWNHLNWDKTKWYTINYAQLEEFEASTAEDSESVLAVETSLDNLSQPIGQSVPADSPECPVDEPNLTQPIPESTSEITTEKNLIVDIVDYFNAKTNANYKSASKKTRKHIRARLREGFTLEDFKRVIDRKTADWLHDSHMNQYLRPETLFGTKFESYLNQQAAGKSLFEKSHRGISVTYLEEDFDLHD